MEKIEEITKPGYVVIKINSPISLRELNELMEKMIDQKSYKICVDITAIPTLPSDNIRFIVLAHKRIERYGKKIAILAQKGVIKTMESMGLNRVIFLSSEEKVVDDFMASQ